MSLVGRRQTMGGDFVLLWRRFPEHGGSLFIDMHGFPLRLAVLISLFYLKY
jgi:hypothetical protein